MEEELSRYPGVTNTEVGYIGGQTNHPSYEQVCSGTTGHAEAVRITFDAKKTSYKALVRRFLESHGSTNDIAWIQGGQYRTSIFCLSPQRSIEANQVIAEIQAAKKTHVSTKVESVQQFWPAEEYHQHYYKKNGMGSCRIF